MNESSVIPSPGWIFVRRNLPAKMTASGIHIPDTARSQHPGITPGEASRVTVLAVNPNDARCALESDDGRTIELDETTLEIPAVGEEVFVLATNESLVPVVTDEYGMCTLSNGFQTPETYLFKLSAVAGRVVREESR